MGRAPDVAAPDLLDESWYVDAGRAGDGAGCVIAEVAAVGLDQCLGARQGRVQVLEVLFYLVRWKAPGTHVRRLPCSEPTGHRSALIRFAHDRSPRAGAPAGVSAVPPAFASRRSNWRMAASLCSVRRRARR